MLKRGKLLWKVLRQTVKEFIADNCARMAAALSYYTVFALPAVMVIVINIAGIFFDADDIHGEIHEEIASVVGTAGAQQVQTMIEKSDQPQSRGGRAIFGIVVLLVGATGVMGQLQGALNEAWGVTPDNDRRAWMNFLIKRLVSLAMVLGVVAALVTSLLLDTLLVAFGRPIAAYLFPDASRWAMMAGNVLASYALFTTIFAVMNKYLPDTEVAWKNVWLGAAITGVLFMAGKWLLSFYLAQRDFASTYGAAGSLALILVWVYYSGIIVLFGAEFTQVWSNRKELENRP